MALEANQANQNSKLTKSVNNSKPNRPERPDEIASLKRALEIINDAAKDSSQELQSMVKGDYRYIKSYFAEAGPQVKEKLMDFKDQSVRKVSEFSDNVSERSKEFGHAVDMDLRERPWSYVGGTAVAAGIFGYLLGRSGR